MRECEKLAKCQFFDGSLPRMPLTAEAIRQTFCLGDYTGCARFQVDNAGKLAPPDLFPNQRGRIPSLLRTQDRTHARQQAEPDVS